jgi:hypothetical protein
LELYRLLYKNSNRIIIIDDFERIADDLTTLGILKQALFSTIDKRIVSYLSSTPLLDNVPESFEFKGKLILLCNVISKKHNEIIKSLLSRCLVYRLDFNYETKIKIFYELAKELGIPFKVVDFIKKHTSQANDTLNFRDLMKANIIYEYYEENPTELNGHSWEVITKNILFQSENKKLKLMIELFNSTKSQEDMLREFIEKEFGSRATFYRYRQKLVSKSQ